MAAAAPNDPSQPTGPGNTSPMELAFQADYDHILHLQGLIKKQSYQPGGYPEEIFINMSEEEKESYTCAICMMIIRDAVSCSNGHLFCQGCIHVWSAGIRDGCGVCPVCRVDPPYAKANFEMSFLLDKMVKCPEPNCKWAGKLSHYIPHESKHKASRPHRAPSFTPDVTKRVVDLLREVREMTHRLEPRSMFSENGDLMLGNGERFNPEESIERVTRDVEETRASINSWQQQIQQQQESFRHMMGAFANMNLEQQEQRGAPQGPGNMRQRRGNRPQRHGNMPGGPGNVAQRHGNMPHGASMLRQFLDETPDLNSIEHQLQLAAHINAAIQSIPRSAASQQVHGHPSARQQGGRAAERLPNNRLSPLNAPQLQEGQNTPRVRRPRQRGVDENLPTNPEAVSQRPRAEAAATQRPHAEAAATQRPRGQHSATQRSRHQQAEAIRLRRYRLAAQRPREPTVPRISPEDASAAVAAMLAVTTSQRTLDHSRLTRLMLTNDHAPPQRERQRQDNMTDADQQRVETLMADEGNGADNNPFRQPPA